MRLARACRISPRGTGEAPRHGALRGRAPRGYLDRNQPEADVAMQASPQLRGHISDAHEVFLAVTAAEAGTTPHRGCEGASARGLVGHVRRRRGLHGRARPPGASVCLQHLRGAPDRDYGRWDSLPAPPSRTLARARGSVPSPRAHPLRAASSRAGDPRLPLERRSRTSWRLRGHHPQLPADALGQEDPALVREAPRRPTRIMVELSQLVLGPASRARPGLRRAGILVGPRPLRPGLGSRGGSLRDRCPLTSDEPAVRVKNYVRATGGRETGSLFWRRAGSSPPPREPATRPRKMPYFPGRTLLPSPSSRPRPCARPTARRSRSSRPRVRALRGDRRPRRLAELEEWAGPSEELSVLVLAGKGNNGGDGLALARMLAIRDARGCSSLSTASAEDGTEDARRNLALLERLEDDELCWLDVEHVPARGRSRQARPASWNWIGSAAGDRALDGSPTAHAPGCGKRRCARLVGRPRRGSATPSRRWSSSTSRRRCRRRLGIRP